MTVVLYQDFNALVRYLNQFSPDQFLTAMSNFHLLVFLATCDMLPLKVWSVYSQIIVMLKWMFYWTLLRWLPRDFTKVTMRTGMGYKRNSSSLFYLKMCNVLKKFIEGNARKSTVNFAFSGYADVIKYQEKPTFSYERAQITEARIINLRAVIKL